MAKHCQYLCQHTHWLLYLQYYVAMIFMLSLINFVYVYFFLLCTYAITLFFKAFCIDMRFLCKNKNQHFENLHECDNFCILEKFCKKDIFQPFQSGKNQRKNWQIPKNSSIGNEMLICFCRKTVIFCPIKYAHCCKFNLFAVYS